jgi:hypothetical protein
MIAEFLILNEPYYFYDDGKINKSRQELIILTEITPFDQADGELINYWKSECYESSLYEPETDYFLKGHMINLVSGGEENVFGKHVFVRSRGGWFSLGWFGGRLDIDGSLTAKLNEIHTS